MVRWFEKRARPLPWRENKTPYRVWVSEVMLQQTTVKVVIEYFERWMERFPTIEALSCASLEEVIKLWEGLGYYSRARRLHSASKKIMSKFQGKIPETYEELKEIEGLGPYTIAAIQSFAFQQKAAAIDGNVIRVVTRLARIQEDIALAKTQKEIKQLVLEWLPKKKPYIAMEALIELGAMICLKKPLCGQCPIRMSCESFHHKDMECYPQKRKKRQTICLKRTVVIISHEEAFLVRKETDKIKIMADLFEFPYFDKSIEDFLQEKLFQPFAKKLRLIKKIDSVIHYFTHHKVTLFPLCYQSDERPDIDGHVWINREDLNKLPFSSGHKKILSLLM